MSLQETTKYEDNWMDRTVLCPYINLRNNFFKKGGQARPYALLLTTPAESIKRTEQCYVLTLICVIFISRFIDWIYFVGCEALLLCASGKIPEAKIGLFDFSKTRMEINIK